MALLDVSFWQLIVEQVHQTSWLEWLGTITGFICIYLAAKEHILNWPISIISAGSYMLLFFEFRLYGDSLLQLYFIGTAVYGWYYWIKRKKEDERPVVSLSAAGWGVTIGAVFVLFILLSLFLKTYTNTNVPYADGFCTAMSFVAQLLMTRKVLQNWILWIIVDICYVPLLIYKGLMLSSMLYAVLVFLALLGYLEWRTTWKKSLS